MKDVANDAAETIAAFAGKKDPLRGTASDLDRSGSGVWAEGMNQLRKEMFSMRGEIWQREGNRLILTVSLERIPKTTVSAATVLYARFNAGELVITSPLSRRGASLEKRSERMTRDLFPRIDTMLGRERRVGM